MTKTESIAAALRWLTRLEREDASLDDAEVDQLPDIVATVEDADLDVEYARRLHLLAPHLRASQFDLDGLAWPYQADEISRGEYPLAELPAHVRAVVETLYYAE